MLTNKEAYRSQAINAERSFLDMNSTTKGLHSGETCILGKDECAMGLQCGGCQGPDMNFAISEEEQSLHPYICMAVGGCG